MNSALNFFLKPTAWLIGVVLGGGILLLFYVLNFFKAEEVNVKKNEAAHPEKKKEVKVKKKTTDTRHTTRVEKKGFSSSWLLTTLKGHTGPVLNMHFSSNGKYLASCSEDRAVLLWNTKDLTHNENKSLRINIEFDHPTNVKWSPDSKAFIISKYHENTLEVYKVDKKKEGWLSSATKAVTFPKVHQGDIIGMDIASTGKYIMSCSNKTDLVVWDLKGSILCQVDTYLMNTTCAKISPCGRFIAASGFAPDARVWEVLFTKSGDFQEVKRIFDLSGHSSGIYDVAFDADSSHVATVSKDGTWKFYDIAVNYKNGEDPHLILTGKYEQAGENVSIALSPNGEVVAIASSNSLSFFSTLTGQLDFTIDSIYSAYVTSILFDATGKYLLTTGDKHIHVFHNVTGYRCGIQSAEEKLKVQQTAATKERLQKLIQDYRIIIDKIENK